MKETYEPIHICPYFNGIKCEKQVTKKYVVDTCLNDYVDCDEFVNLERITLNQEKKI